ncbi:MAG TPA: glycosyltransferase family 4 protein [Geminicoccaceae bacterium]
MLLPYAEGFGPGDAGAIALGVRDLTLASRFRDRTRVFGRAVRPSFEGIDFRPLAPALPRLLGRNRGLAEAFRRAAARRRDVLVELHNRPLMAHWLARLAPSLPLSIRLANDPLSTRDLASRRARARLLERVRAVYCVSDFVRTRFLSGLEGGADKLHVVRNGVARPDGPPVDKERLILYVGRVVAGKGVDHLVEALLAVLPERPDWRALIIGASRPGATSLTPFEERLRRRAAPLGDRVRWLRFLPNSEVMGHYRAAAITVVPSTVHEALSRTSAEGLAHGCAVIGYASGGIPEVVRGRGLVLDEKTPTSLGAALARLTDDAAYRSRLQQRAREDFPFTVQAMADGYDAVREGLLEDLARSVGR